MRSAARLVLAVGRRGAAAAAAATAVAAAAAAPAPAPPSSSAVSAAATAATAAAASPDSSRVLSSAEAARLHPRLHVVDTSATRALLTILRDATTPHVAFALAADRLMRLLAEEALAAAPGSRPKVVTTPCGTFEGIELAPASDLVVVSIVRSGDTLMEAVRKVAPAVGVGKILIQRDESSPKKDPRLYYVKLPHDIAKRTVLLVDPMLATGGSATMAIRELLDHGVEESRIVFVNVVACPEGVARLRRAYPQVRIVTSAVDGGLNERMYIVPGLGDFGDRYFGTT